MGFYTGTQDSDCRQLGRLLRARVLKRAHHLTNEKLGEPPPLHLISRSPPRRCTPVSPFTVILSKSGLRPSFFLRYGEFYLLVGRIDQAASHARKDLALSRRLGAPGIEAQALRLSGDVSATAGAKDAEGCYREAMTLAEPRGMRPLVAHCHLGLGKLHRRSGDLEQAQEHLTTAMAMYREMGMTYWPEQAEAELHQLG
jgi:tetratricopeptide (TPR) repeat protein